MIFIILKSIYSNVITNLKMGSQSTNPSFNIDITKIKTTHQGSEDTEPSSLNTPFTFQASSVPEESTTVETDYFDGTGVPKLPALFAVEGRFNPSEIDAAVQLLETFAEQRNEYNNFCGSAAFIGQPSGTVRYSFHKGFLIIIPGQGWISWIPENQSQEIEARQIKKNALQIQSKFNQLRKLVVSLNWKMSDFDGWVPMY